MNWNTLQTWYGNIISKTAIESPNPKYQKAADFNGFHIRKDSSFDVFYFHFIQENEYVKTTHVMTYIRDPDYYLLYRTFYEEYSEHNYDKLIANPRFKKLIKNMGLELDGCSGGYETYLKESSVDVTFTDKISIKGHLKVENNICIYNLDLN